MKYSFVALFALAGLAAATPVADGWGDHNNGWGGMGRCEHRNWWECCKWDHSHTDDIRCHNQRCNYRWESQHCCHEQGHDNWWRNDCCRDNRWGHDNRCRGHHGGH